MSAPQLQQGSWPPSPSSPRAGYLTLGVPTASPSKEAHVTQPDRCMPSLPGTFSNKQGFSRGRKPSGIASL